MSGAVLLKLQKKHKKSSTEKQSSAIIVHETKRTATSTRTTQTRQNNPYRLGAAPAGVVGAETAAVRTWCGGAMGISNAMPLRACVSRVRCRMASGIVSDLSWYQKFHDM